MKGVVSKFTQGLVNLKPLLRVDKLAMNVLYPPVCLVCGQSGQDSLDCCAGCQQDLPRPAGQCARCALAIPVDRPLCGACTQKPPPFDAVIAPFVYGAPVDRLIQAFKFQRDLAAGRVLAGLLTREISQKTLALPQCLIPVPLHARRQLWRGFNQADFLARDLARNLGGMPVVRPLKRRRRTATQSGLPANKRRGNVRGAFVCKPLPDTLRHLALIDDVMTTGSTVAECARILKQAGAERVDVWAVARA